MEYFAYTAAAVLFFVLIRRAHREFVTRRIVARRLRDLNK